MGRPIPSSQANSSSLSLPLFAASIAASITVFVTLCMSHHRKLSSPKSQPSTPKQQLTSLSSSSSSDKSIKKTKKLTKPIPTPSPPPPQQQQPIEDQEHMQSPPQAYGPIVPTSPVNASTSQRRFSGSFSVRLTEGLSKICTTSKKVQEKPVEEESVWMKTIILGERCKVSSDDEDEAAIRDQRGNRQRIYHPRRPRSLPVSRTNSFATVEAAASCVESAA